MDTNNKLFIGDYPILGKDRIIDGRKVTPENLQAVSGLNRDMIVLFDNKFPKDIKGFLKYSRFPLYIFSHKYKIPKAFPVDKFEIVSDGEQIDLMYILKHIFYNPNRDVVFSLLMNHKPPAKLLYKWLEMNIPRVYNKVPELIEFIDEKVIDFLSPLYLYNLVAFGLKPSSNLKRMKWIGGRNGNG